LNLHHFVYTADICLIVPDSGDDMLDPMSIKKFLEHMMRYITFAGRQKLCPLVGKNLPPGSPYVHA